MKWSWQIGKLAGIGIYVHATFLILVGWIAIVYWNAHHSVAAVVGGIAFIVALFACVVLHELGHALAAKRYGIETKDITLLPIGGLARLERMPKEPRQELVVAIAGPLVNVVIAGAIYIALLLSGTSVSITGATLMGAPFLTQLMYVNIVLVIFNMLPAFPMDGGRVLRALLASQMDYTTATRHAANVGQLMALGFGVIGFLANPFLILIALFVWIAGAQEAGAVRVRAALHDIPVQSAMWTDFRSVETDMTLADVVQRTLALAQKDFPVVQGGIVVGVLLHADILQALATTGPGTTVGEVMQTDVQFAHTHDMLEGILERFQQSGSQIMPVTRKGQLVGMITLENISEWLLFQGAIEGSETKARWELQCSETSQEAIATDRPHAARV